MLHLDESAQRVLITSISRDTWAPLDFHLFAVLTGQAGRRAAQIVRQILDVPDDGAGRHIEYGRSYIYDAPSFGCRIARCYYRAPQARGPVYWWRRFALDVTDETILESARAELLPAAHLHGQGAPAPAPSPEQPQLIRSVAPTRRHVDLSDADLRSEIDRARQHLHDLEAVAAGRIADHERTIALLRGVA